MFSQRFGCKIVITLHARQRMQERDISDSLLGTSKNRSERTERKEPRSESQRLFK